MLLEGCDIQITKPKHLFYRWLGLEVDTARSLHKVRNLQGEQK